MRIGVHVGLGTVNYDVQEVLAHNHATLRSHDWVVAPEEHQSQ